MPRIVSDPRNHEFRKLEALICGSMKAERKTLVDLCSVMCKSHCTVRKLLRDPSKLTLGELASIRRNLHIPIVSDSFNMKAYRPMVEAAETSAALNNPVSYAGTQGLIALFDGTELTGDVFINRWREIGSEAVEAAVAQVYEWYTGIKYNGSVQSGTQESSLVHIYHYFHKNMRYLPGDVDMQDPQMMLDLLALDVEQGGTAAQAPPGLEDLYAF